MTMKEKENLEDFEDGDALEITAVEIVKGKSGT